MAVSRDLQLAVATAPNRDSRHWVNGYVTWGEILDWMPTPAGVKECGNYMMGSLATTKRQHKNETAPCTNVHRTKDAVLSRSALTLDLDTPAPGLADALELVLPWAALLHTTFQSTKDYPRYRLIIPLNRELHPDEYVAAATVVMELVGRRNFDPGSDQPERYMFKPSAEVSDDYDWRLYDGDLAVADDILKDWDYDLSNRAAPDPGVGKKRNPYEIDGVVGAFNRAYDDFQILIEEYGLPYAPAGAGRWHLVGSKAVAGMGEVTPGLVYSHHANDPAFGQACSAFDLVRLHRFGELDEDANPQTPVNKLPSHDAMLDLAMVDSRVTAEMVGADFADDLDDQAKANDWRLTLTTHMNRQGHLKDTADAWGIIRENDKVIQGILYNEMTFAIESKQDLPWRPLSRGGPVLRADDRLSLQVYLEKEYRTQPTARRVDWMVGETAMQNYTNPVKEWLEQLEWDGIERLETSLPGVAVTDYTRMVARKCLVAAVARMMEPGCKWDHTLILYGKEGLGKTHWIEKMSRGWTAPLGMMGQKDTLINLQRCWIVTSDEGASMKKADADALKEFLTRRVDTFRMPYERDASVHPRHCVIWGTTNDEVFLRYQEGNRRFLIVRCEERVDFAKLTDFYVEQVWAEAMHLYRMGETLLFLDETESGMAEDARESFVEEGSTALEGIAAAYLDLPVPGDWRHRGTEERLRWLRDVSDGLEPKGDERQDAVCALQIYVEALGKPQGNHTRLDLLEIGKSLRALGWVPRPGRHRLGPYGPQVVYDRPAQLGLEDLL